MRNYLLSFFFFLFSFSLFAQLSTDPEFPTTNVEVIVYFHADEGNAALKNYSGDVYAHTGLITENSVSSSDWKYVLTGWNENTSKNKLIKLSDNLYKFTISPDIIQFYGVPEDEKVKKLAFVFRNSDGTKVARTVSGGDMFYDVYEDQLALSIDQPKNKSIYELNEQVSIVALANETDSLLLYINDDYIQRFLGDSLNYTYSLTEQKKHSFKVLAYKDGENSADSIWVYVRDEVPVLDLPEGMKDGINYLDDNSVCLVLYAPYKEFVYLVGDFNDWDFSSSQQPYIMNKTPDGLRHWIEIGQLEAQKEYAFQYYVEGEMFIADPYAEKILDPWNDKYIGSATYPDLMPYPSVKATGIVSVLQTAQETYEWKHTDFTPPPKENLVIYELLIRDFIADHSYLGLIDTLAYLKKLGINAIELMPIMEFEGNESWGYNPSFFFAPDKYYGTKNHLKAFIDTCHANGIAVILDIALNHAFGQSPLVQLYFDPEAGQWGEPTAENPWFNQRPKHDYNVGYDFNHESDATKLYASRALKHWLDEYKVDGYRLDLSKGFTQMNTLGNVGLWGQYDASRVAILKAYADSIWKVNVEAYVILEHFADNSEEKVLSEYGMLLWGNMNHAYNEATMGYLTNSDFSGISYKNRAWTLPHLIGYMESHDEERLTYKNIQYGNSNGEYNIKELSTAIDRIELAANFLFTVPGPKMFWQFGELAYDIPIDFNGRTGNKPIKWEYYDEPGRKRLYQVFSALINLKVNHPAFSTNDFSMVISSYGAKRINLYHESMDVVVLGNFDLSEQPVNPNFSREGTWYEFYSGQELTVDDTEKTISLKPGEYRIYTTEKLTTPEIISSVEENHVQNNSGLIKVYPNPVSDELRIRSEHELDFIQIYDITGKLVRQTGGNADGNLISVRELSGGIYFLRVKTVNNLVINTKFLKSFE